jgi:DNA-binding NarL/FixJ family response regulator
VESAKTAVVFHRYPLVLRAVESLLQMTGLTIAGAATHPEEALTLLEQLKPDLFIAALATPPGSMDGIELLRRARQAQPALTTIGLADEDDDHRVEEVFAAGASAFLGMTARQADVAFAVRQAYEPSIHLALARGSKGRQPQASPDSAILTEREREILGLVAKGYSNIELARMLDVALQTVKYHLSNIYRKLNVGNRTQATHQAQLLNLLPRNGRSGSTQPDPAKQAQTR